MIRIRERLKNRKKAGNYQGLNFCIKNSWNRPASLRDGSNHFIPYITTFCHFLEREKVCIKQILLNLLSIDYDEWGFA